MSLLWSHCVIVQVVVEENIENKKTHWHLRGCFSCRVIPYPSLTGPIMKYLENFLNSIQDHFHKEINLSPSDIHAYNSIIFSLCFLIITWPAYLLSLLSALALQSRQRWLFTLGDNDHPHHTQVLLHFGFIMT